MLCTRVERGRVSMKVDVNKCHTIKMYAGRNNYNYPVQGLHLVRNYYKGVPNRYMGKYHHHDGGYVQTSWDMEGVGRENYLDLVEIHIPDNVIKCKMPAAWLQKQVRDEECKNG